MYSHPSLKLTQSLISRTSTHAYYVAINERTIDSRYIRHSFRKRFTTSFRVSEFAGRHKSQDANESTPAPEDGVSTRSSKEPDEIARDARKRFGDVLPPGFLNPDEHTIYKRLYGTPRAQSAEDIESDLAAQTLHKASEPDGPDVDLLSESEDGTLRAVPYATEQAIDSDSSSFADAAVRSSEKLAQRKAKMERAHFFKTAGKAEIDEALLTASDQRLGAIDVADDWAQLHDMGREMYLDDVRYLQMEQLLRRDSQPAQADNMLRDLFLRYRSGREIVPIDQVQQSLADTESHNEEMDDDDDAFEAVQRTHPFTEVNRFRTFPTTLQLPKDELVRPISRILSAQSIPQLTRTAQGAFGGPELPWSASTPRYAKNKQQKPIPLSPMQTEMTPAEANSYLTAVAPGVYASVTSVLTEVRKRLGAEWLQTLMRKPGGPRILDAGSGGAGVLSMRDVLAAEWQLMHDQTDDAQASKSLSLADGQTGAAPADVPTGKATVLIGNDCLRQRISTMLDNTTFVPRLPDYINASDDTASQRGKFDIIIAPHSLWPIFEEHKRKRHVANLWSLLDSTGGVLILLEKGLPKGFETVAAARQFLLDKRIQSGPVPDEPVADELDPGVLLDESERPAPKDAGMIIAPCTNHTTCPMYSRHGGLQDKRNCCHFEQRYIRPPFLQSLLGAKDKNYEDVKFSYLAVMRGRDLRSEQSKLLQGDEATDRAFAGYEHESEQSLDEDEVTFDPTAPAIPETARISVPGSVPHSLNLPRAVLPPLKRTGHVIIDLCTPSGRLERWTVPRSFSKQAYRDARKSSWGDLWALGAKTRVVKDKKDIVQVVKGKKRAVDSKGRKISATGKKLPTRAKNVVDVPVNERGRVAEQDIKVRAGGRQRHGKIKGIRDKRIRQESKLGSD